MGKFSFQFLVFSYRLTISKNIQIADCKLWTLLQKSIFLLLLLLSSYSQAQTSNIKVKRDSLVDILVQQHIKHNESKDIKKGYRIQLMASPNRTKVGNERYKFSKLYPDTKTYIHYQQPYFKLRVGDFKDHYQAYKFLEEIKSSFRGAFPVQDKIN